MSHKFTGSNGTRFFYDGDFKGMVMIFEGDTPKTIRVPIEDILQFAAGAVRKKSIATVEDIPWEAILYRESTPDE